MAARTRAFVVAAVVCAVSLPGVATSRAALPERPAVRTVDWPQFHGRPNHQGLNRAERGIGRDNVSSLALSWIGNGATAGADLVSQSSPTVVDGYVYFGTVEGQLLAFRASCRSSQCQPAWRLDLREGILDTPAVVDGVLYVGTASRLGRLYAFDVSDCAATAGDCDPLWTAKVNVGQSSPTVTRGIVYVGSYENDVYAFNASGCGGTVCQPRWIGHTDGYVLNSPAVSHGAVYAGDSTGYLYAFDATGCGSTSGTRLTSICTALWRGRAANQIYASSPVVHAGLVYTTSFGPDPDSLLEVFVAGGCGRAICRPEWRGTGGHYLNSPPAVAYGSVYLGSSDGLFRVYPAKGCGRPTCSASWIGYAAGPVAAIDSAPMVANGVVYIGGDNARIRAFPARGCGRFVCDKLWEFITQDPIVDSSPVMVNSTLYVSGTNFGAVPELYVFTLDGGRG